MSKFPFVLIVGPTASGKSDLGLQLAMQTRGAILNCDSVQAYARLDIGSAKPSPEDMRACPHHLFSMVAPGEVLTAGDFRASALGVLKDALITAPVIGVGGSGFYIQALEKGMFDVPKPKPEVEQRVRERLSLLGLPALYEELKRRDPKYALKVSANDAYRITRALILMDDSGQSVTEVRENFLPQPFPYTLLKLGLAPAREILLQRVQARTKQMLKQGLLSEVEALVREGFRNWPALESVGYAQCLDVLEGRLAHAQLEDKIVEKTMQLAKKQRTWFKRDPTIKWLDPERAIEQAQGELALTMKGLRG